MATSATPTTTGAVSIDLYFIQSFPPHLMNRSDTGHPKDCVYGGSKRRRVSSQSFKRAIRTHSAFPTIFNDENILAARTRYIIDPLVTIVGNLIGGAATPEQIQKVAWAFVNLAMAKVDQANNRTAALVFISSEELQAMGKAIADNWNDLSFIAGEKVKESDVKEAIKPLATGFAKAFVGRTSAPDVALFGRMMASAPTLTLPAAVSVGQVIGTSKTVDEIDFYAAVDEWAPNGGGAGMIDYQSYASGETMFRFMHLDLRQLTANLAGDQGVLRCTLQALIVSSLFALPSGKSTAFNTSTVPDFAVAVVRGDNQSFSMAGAFERPVMARGDSGLLNPSAARFDSYFWKFWEIYDLAAAGRLRTVALIGPGIDDESVPNFKGSPVLVANTTEWIVGIVSSALGVG